MNTRLILVTVLVFTVACSQGPRPSCFDLCPAGETTGLLSDPCPNSTATPRVNVNCVCLTKDGGATPVSDCEDKAVPGKGTYDYVCEDTCR